MSQTNKSKQTSLHSFFNTLKTDGSILEVKRFFYIRWTNKYAPDIQAVWLQERPSDVNFIEEVKWNQVRKTHTFYLCGYFPDLNEGRFRLPHESKYKNISILKSHLQKNIRKQNEQLALSTAVHMMNLDVVELLRRLPIIMIEDVMLHESFTTLIWLMVSQSSTTFKFKRYMYEWILGVIYVLCKIPTKDFVNHHDITEMKLINRLDTFGQDLKNNLLNDSQLSLLYCMYVRIAYGGMNCDMEMFELSADTWYKRFKGEENDGIIINRDRIRCISYMSVKTLELDEWDLSALDFHCCNKLIEFIQKRFPDVDESEIKELIWKNSSRINTRTNYPICNPSLWNQMKNHVEKTQKYLLDSNY